MYVFFSFFLSLFSRFSFMSLKIANIGELPVWSLVRTCVPCVQVATPLLRSDDETVFLEFII